MKLSSEKRVEWGLAAFLVVLLIGLMLGVSYFMQKTSNFIIKEETYQYTHDQKLMLPFNLQYQLKPDSSLELVLNSTNYTPDNSPLYYCERQGFLLVQDMILVDTEDARQNRVVSTSEINVEENKTWLMTSGNRQTIENKFLFDGNHLYVFLEAVILNINGEEVMLSNLSFVEVIPNVSVRIYDYQSDKLTLLTSFDNYITAQDEGRTYTIDLMNDSMKAVQGQDILLFTSSATLEDINKEELK